MRNSEEEWKHGLKIYSWEIWLWYAQCTDLKPIQMSPAGNLILNTIAKIWNLKSQNTEDGVAGLMEKETGVVSSQKPLK